MKILCLILISHCILLSRLLYFLLQQERVVMILLSGGTKARHRGASLVRNLLYSPSTRGTLAQVSIHCELQCIRTGAVDCFSVVKSNACFMIALTNVLFKFCLLMHIILQVPGMAKALQKLQKSADEETLQRATVAVKLLAEYQQQHGSLCGSVCVI